MDQEKAVLFHNAYIEADSSELDRLWQTEAPQTLIKFFPANYQPDGTNYFLEHLTKHELWLSSPSCFNDPFDSVINFDYRNYVEQTSREILIPLVGEETALMILASDNGSIALNDLANRFRENMHRIHKKLEQSIYTSCFADVDNLKSLRMWGYYANCHTGVCAEYVLNDVHQSTQFACIPIRYTDNYEYIINTTNQKEDTRNFLKLYTKSLEWKYEKEWRVNHQRDDFIGSGYAVRFAQPKRVYLGCKVGSKLKNDVAAICEKQGIELHQMSVRPSSFCMDVTRIR